MHEEIVEEQVQDSMERRAPLCLFPSSRPEPGNPSRLAAEAEPNETSVLQ